MQVSVAVKMLRQRAPVKAPLKAFVVVAMDEALSGGLQPAGRCGRGGCAERGYLFSSESPLLGVSTRIRQGASRGGTVHALLQRCSADAASAKLSDRDGAGAGGILRESPEGFPS